VLSNEDERLSALHRLKILDTSKEERFDRITRLAKSLFSCEFSSISLIDTDRQWFKSSVNLEVAETERDVAFCAHTIAEKSHLIVRDTHQDKRFKDNPFVVDEPGIRFYAGVNIMIDDLPVGTLCVFHTEVKPFDDGDIKALADLGKIQKGYCSNFTSIKVNLKKHKNWCVFAVRFLRELCRRNRLIAFFGLLFRELKMSTKDTTAVYFYLKKTD
jgi:hypothetical protein